jgi:hypothetical protein
MQFILEPKKLLRTTFFIVLFLCFMHVVQYLAETYMPGMFARKLASTFNLDYEHNVPTFFSFMQLWVAALILGFVAVWSGRKKSPDSRYWWTLSLVFVYLGVDELEELHEITVKFMQKAFHFTGVLYNAWIIPGAIACLVVGLYFLRFVLRLPKKTRNGVIISGAVFVTSAIGGDMVSGYFFTKYGSYHNVPCMIENLFEESGEMLSIAYFIYTLLNYYRDEIGMPIQISVSNEGKGASNDTKTGQLIKLVKSDVSIDQLNKARTGR